MLQLPPAIAGGRLLYFNQVVTALAKAPANFKIQINQNLHRAVDRQIQLLNSHGNHVSIALPKEAERPDWRISPEEHNCLVEEILANLVSGPNVEDIIESILPQVGETLAEASRAFWQKYHSGGAFIKSEVDGETPSKSPVVGPEITWIGPRQLLFLQDYQITQEQALGEAAALRKLIGRDKRNEIVDEIEETLRQIENMGTDMGSKLKQKNARLFSTWNRFSRELGRASQKARRASLNFSNMKSEISAAKINALAESLRPQAKAQQHGLSLLAGIVNLRLQPKHLDFYAEQVKLLGEQGSGLVSTSKTARLQ